ncbi:polysaccharide deacetylase family protein [Peribacillus sp. NPDC097284]|uniref:polysaccharide deacetylase family protein n=1 Tax=Peribacillus sp. NPDC097284 TaxID=3364401 RepID=UPI0037F8D7F7
MLIRPLCMFAMISLVLMGCNGMDVTPVQNQKTVETSSNIKNEQKEVELSEKQEEPIEKGKAEEEKVQVQYRLNEANWSFEPIKDADPKVVLLTFDDAPDKYSLDIAKTLHELQVPAIFFVNGHFIEDDEKKKILKEIHDMGFLIGNHTYSHVNLKEQTDVVQKKEIVKLNDLVEEIVGERPKFIRAPFGTNTEYSKGIAKQEKMLVMNWTYGYDWEKEYQNDKALTNIMLNSPYLSNGANLLMHDRKWTHDAIEDIVNGFQKKGYTFLDPRLIETPA